MEQLLEIIKSLDRVNLHQAKVIRKQNKVIRKLKESNDGLVRSTNNANEKLQGMLLDEEELKKKEVELAYIQSKPVKGETEYQWMLRIREAGWYELDDIAKSIRDEEDLGDGDCPTVARCKISALDMYKTKQVLRFDSDHSKRTLYFVSPREHVSLRSLDPTQFDTDSENVNDIMDAMTSDAVSDWKYDGDSWW